MSEVSDIMGDEFRIGIELDIDDASISNIKNVISSIKLNSIQLPLNINDRELFNQFKAIQREMAGMAKNYTLLDSGKNTKEIELLKKQFRELGLEADKTLRGVLPNLNDNQRNQLLRQEESYIRSVELARQKAADRLAVNEDKQRKQQRLKELADYEKQQSAIQKSNERYNKQINKKRDSIIDRVDSRYYEDKLSSIARKINSNDTTSKAYYDKANSYYAMLQKARKNLSSYTPEQILHFDKNADLLYRKAARSSSIFNRSVELARNNKDVDFLNKRIKPLKENYIYNAIYGEQLNSIRNKLNSGNLSISDIAGLKKEFNEITSSIDGANSRSQSFVNTLKSYVSATVIIGNVVSGVKQMYQEVRKIDTAMTELKKVTNETDITYKDFLNGAGGQAKQIGTTIDNYIQSTADFARLGYNFKEAQKLSKTANIYNVVGDDISGIDDASSSIISTMAAFNIEADKSMSIVDKFNKVGNEFPIASGGIGQALTRSASSLSAANNDLDQSIALITAANKVVQNPEQIGTAFKTLSMRIRGAKTDMTKAGLDTDGMASSVSKLRAEIKSLAGVDIMKDSNTFKSTYDIIDELSKVWSKLDDITQANVTELIAGKRQGNIISSLMTNFDTAREALKASRNSNGSAKEEHEKWLESLDAKTNQFKASWQDLSQTFLNSDFLKVGLDGIIGLTNGLSGLLKVIPTPVFLSGLFAIGKFLSDVHKIKSTTEGIGNIGSIKSLIGSIKETKNIAGIPLNVAGWGLGIGAGIAILTSAYNVYREQINRENEKARSDAEKLSKTNTDIDSQILKVKELRTALDSGTLSEQDAYNAKSQLLSIQNSLKESYSGTANSINLVNGGLEEQIRLMNQVKEKEARTYLDENNDAVNRAEKEMTRTRDRQNEILTIATGGYGTKNKNITADISRLQKYLSNRFGNLIGDLNDSGGFNAFGNVFQDEKILEAATAYISDNNLFSSSKEANKYKDSLLSSLSSQRKIINDVINEYNTQFVEGLRAKVTIDTNRVSGKTSNEWLNDYESKIKSLNDAILSGDKNKQSALLKEFEEIDSILEPMLKDGGSLQKYGRLFELSKETVDTKGIGKIKLFQSFSKELESSVKSIDKIKDVDLKSINLNDGNFQDGEKALRAIVDKAVELGLVSDISNKSVEEVVDTLVQLGIVGSDSFTALDNKMGELQNSLTTTAAEYASLATAFKENSGGTGLSSESVKAIREMYIGVNGFNERVLFEKTANGIHLNATALRELEVQKIATNKVNMVNELNRLNTLYADSTNRLAKATAGTKEYNDVLLERSGYENRINNLELLISQYDGLTSAYNRWQQAQSQSDERDMYSGILSGRENVNKLIQQGWVGDEEVRNYIDLLSSKDLSTASVEEYMNEYQRLQSTLYNNGMNAFSFMTKDANGNATVDGVYNFFDTIASQFEEGYVKVDQVVDEYGNVVDKYNFNFDGITDRGLADKLGIDVEYLQSILRAAKDAGFDINLTSTVQSVEELNQKIKNTETKLKELGYTPIEIDISNINIDNVDSEIQRVKDRLEEINKGTFSPEVKTELESDANAKLDLLIAKKIELERPSFMNISVSDIEDYKIQNALNLLQQYQEQVELVKTFELKGDVDSVEFENAKAKVDELSTKITELDNKEVKVKIGLGGVTSKEQLDEAIKNGGVNFDESKKNVLIVATADVKGQGKVDRLNGSLDTLRDKYVKVDAQVFGLSPLANMLSYIDRLSDKTVNVTQNTHHVHTYSNISPTRTKQGNSVMVNGTAFAHGSWGTKSDGTALVGELGTELLVRDGKFYTIGDNSAEFINYKKNDIIFNAEQTKQIFEKGRITYGKTRGQALALGTAFSNGSYGSGIGRIRNNYHKSSIATQSAASSSAPSTTSTVPASTSFGKSDTSSKNNNRETEDVIDWIEIAIKRIQKAISTLDKQASSIYKLFSKRNQSLQEQISFVTDEIDLQSKAYDRYIQQANSVGLSENYASAVRNGTIDISKITDEDLSKKIKEYQQWYEKALQCDDAIAELTETVSKLYKQGFENVVKEFENTLSEFENHANLIDKYVKQAELQGYMASTIYYEELSKIEKKNLQGLKDEEAALLDSLGNAVKNGDIEIYSEAWYEMKKNIDSVSNAIVESQNKLIEFSNTIRDIEWKRFDNLHDNISGITQEADFLVKLLSSKDLYDKKGQFTKNGLATLGMDGLNYNVYMEQSLSYARELQKIENEIAKSPHDTALIKRKQELLNVQRDMILAAENERKAIKDLVKEGIDKELSSLNEIIKKYNDDLSKKKSMYDYQKKIAKQTSEITDLQKQLSAYSGDTSEESRKIIQELTVSLKDAEDDLEQTQYEQFISDQKQLLDELYTEYELILNQRLDNIDVLITDMIGTVNENFGSINEIILNESKALGYNITSEMRNVWNTQSEDGKATRNVLTTYNNNFLTFAGDFAKYNKSNIDKLTELQSVLGNINTGISKLVSLSDKKATTSVSKAANTSKKPATTSNNAKSKPTTSTKPVTKNSNSGDGVPNIGDEVTYIGGTYFYDSYGTSPSGNRGAGGKVKITYMNPNSPYPIHVESKDSAYGWLRLDQIRGYASGTRSVPKNGYAWTQENGDEIIIRKSDGALLTPLARNDSVLNSMATDNIWNVANNPARFIAENSPVILGSSGGLSQNIQNFDNITFVMPNVKNYSELLSEMQRDNKFETLIQSMTIGRLNGGNSLSKNRINF